MRWLWIWPFVAVVLVGEVLGRADLPVDSSLSPSAALDPLLAIFAPLPGACYPLPDRVTASISVAAIPSSVRLAVARWDILCSGWELRVLLDGTEATRQELSLEQEASGHSLVLSVPGLPDGNHRLSVLLLPPSCGNEIGDDVLDAGWRGQAHASFSVDGRGRCEQDAPEAEWDEEGGGGAQAGQAGRREMVNVALGRPTETSSPSGGGGEDAVDGEAFRSPGSSPPSVSRVGGDAAGGGAWWAVDLAEEVAVAAMDVVGDVAYQATRHPQPQTLNPNP